MVALGFQLLGVGEMPLRLPSMLAYLGLLAATFGIGARLFGPWTGLLATLLAALHPTLAAQSCVGMLDTTMLAFSMAGLYCLLRAQTQPRWFLGWGLGCGLALLTKGEAATPVLLTSALYLLAARRDALHSPHLIGGLLLALGLPGIWFGSQFLLHRDLFLKPHYQDFVDYRFKHSWRDAALYLKSPRHLWASWGGLAPFLAAAALWTGSDGFRATGTGADSTRPRFEAQGILLVLLAGLVPLVMVSVVRQQKEWYMLPAVVPLALLAAHASARCLRGDGPRGVRWGAFLCLAAGPWVPGAGTGPLVLRILASALALAAAAVGGRHSARRRWTAGICFAAALVLTVLVALSPSNPSVNLMRRRDSSTLRALADRLPPVAAVPGPLVVNFRHYPLNSLMFYARRHSLQLRTFTRRGVAPGARFVGVLIGGGCREFFRGLDVRSLGEQAGYEIVLIANTTEREVIPAETASTAAAVQ
jgi:4-amino-4-deoxy-L-arabinose transferase-like glycosyltransferase